ncbi:inositol-pentakisphosphate 2-kinase-like [Acipenser oxyrinchus oxyrinchus]|uniref:Inositol-pentakisphosphate 2-kinase n=1 Tax=Acipenser oxyrinchus oxyrinchus TaxID=40147 RepID=A0AAD8D3D2_ACIOX|nr:inositol-pentakisphosphate 2-kinase-like [Acipenser oxyrinchus oxyrinchus]
MEVDKMDENEWKYHGEGNKSLVVSHVEHSQVLRFLKYPAEEPGNSHKAAKEAFGHLQNIVDFSKNVMKPFLGENYVHHGEVVHLPLDFVRQLSLKVEQERPESRCDKVMDIFSGYALCLPNLTKLQTCHFSESVPPLCIEIKPKCGFLPFSSHVTKDVKHRVCRFCMHQHLKLANGKWKRMSRYCPLDLFSGNKQRMSFALKNLLQEAQNNLKIFKNGELIYGCKDDKDCLQDLNAFTQHLKPYFFPANGLIHGPHCTRTVINELINVITTALLSNSGTCRTGEIRKVHISEGRAHCDASHFHRDILRKGSHSGLPKDCVLSKILQAQMLDNVDIEGLHPLYNRVEQYLGEFPKERIKLQIDGPYNENCFEKLRNSQSEDNGTVDYAVRKVQQYRVAMTAKDCSIMIALSPCPDDELPEPNLVIQTSKSRLIYSVSILDLDPKPYENIPHQYKLDGQIVNFYLKSTQAKQDPPTPNLFMDSEDCTLVLHSV